MEVLNSFIKSRGTKSLCASSLNIQKPCKNLTAGGDGIVASRKFSQTLPCFQGRSAEEVSRRNCQRPA